MTKKHYPYQSDDPKFIDAYQQESFRRKAQQNIDATKRALKEGSFAKIQKNAVTSTLEQMKRAGIIDSNGNPLTKTQKETAEIFQTYYETYIQRVKIADEQNLP